MKKLLLPIAVCLWVPCVFAGTWFQTITLNNDTTYPSFVTTAINTGDFTSNANDEFLNPQKVITVKAKAPNLDEGDEITLHVYLDDTADQGVVDFKISMVDDVGVQRSQVDKDSEVGSTQTFTCKSSSSKFRCLASSSGDTDNYSGNVTIIPAG
jgi:hypothetical protein